MFESLIGHRREILARAEASVTVRRQADVDDLNLLLIWADSHSGDPQDEPGARSVRNGGPRLVNIGGQGTPQVIDLCFAEMAIARQASEVATRNATADALDLRHRLPLIWAHTQNLRCETWVARKIARMARQLDRTAARLVDQAIADAIDQSPSRLLTIAEAKIIEADQAAHQARIQENLHQRGVWFPTPPPGSDINDTDSTAGVRTVFGRLDHADALELEQTIEDLAQLLAERGDFPDSEQPTWDQLRAESLGLLARPADALALITDNHDHGRHPRPARRKATVVVHLSDTTLGNKESGIARLEHLGPMLTDQLTRLLGHREISILPVIDLSQTRSVNGYEHPTDMKNRTALRTLGDVFPHSAARPEARVDHDHPTPYQDTGPPGQTSDHNDAPLTRRHHRAKTHLGYHVEQLGPGTYRWTTPHGLIRVVTPRGTRRVELIRSDHGEIYGDVYRSNSPGFRLEL
ncbi:hypothetical protein [Demetria terragena]|uniref:hypothetical protein n=1 Tax=Demetria terragena TaxID=63959 RepID=UPI0003A17A5A|nr:hypothetical protein [Demetria terragena]